MQIDYQLNTKMAISKNKNLMDEWMREADLELNARIFNRVKD